MPSRPDSYIIGERWWTLAELASSVETFASRRLPSLLTDIVDARYPARPVDCGV